MHAFHRLPILLLLSVLPLLFIGCKKDVRRRLGEGARYVKSNPDKAIEILDGVLKDKPDEFMAVYYIGLAYRYKKDWVNAEQWFRKALDVGKGRNGKTIRRFLREIYLKQANDAKKQKNRAKQIESLWKAAKLERKIRDMASASIEANATLYKLLSEDVDRAVREKRYQDAIKLAKEIRTLWYDASKLSEYRKRIREFARADFRMKFYAAFDKDVKDKLIQEKAYLPENKLISVVVEVAVPSKDTDARFDPEGEKFLFNVEALTRLDAQKKLIGLVARSAGKKVESLSRDDLYVLDVLAKDKLKEVEKKWVTEKEKYTMTLTLPLAVVEDWSYRLMRRAERRKRKGLKAPKGAPKKAPEKKGDEKKAPEKKAPEKKGDEKKAPEKKGDEKKAPEKK